MVKRQRSTQITDKKLDFWIQHNLNVMFIGRHGVGKTSMVREAWNRHGLNWAYFSGATLDPWVDFVGIPEKYTDPETGITSLRIVNPEWMLQNVEAIFLDEYNRTHKKVRNAVMEAIQFGTINGRRLGKLRFIWAAVNPDDEEDEDFQYDVDRVDPAQLDRFQVHVYIKYAPSKTFFSTEFGSDIASAAISWWDSQSEDTQKLVSPRRLEYAIRYFLANGNLSDVLPSEANVNKLASVLKNTPIITKLRDIYKNRDVKAGKEYLEDPDIFVQCWPTIIRKNEFLKWFLPLLPEERIVEKMVEESKVRDLVGKNYANVPVFKSVADEIIAANTDKDIVNRLKNLIRISAPKIMAPAIDRAKINSNADIYEGGSKPNNSLESVVTALENSGMENTHQRRSNWESFLNHIPSDLSQSQALIVLGFSELLASKSHPKTLKEKCDHYLAVVNLAVKNLSEEDLNGFEENYPYTTKYIVEMDPNGFYFAIEAKPVDQDQKQEKVAPF